MLSADFSGRLGSFTLDARFEAPLRGLTALFGPSGSGKTTVLRGLAGLQKVAGSLSVGGEIWQDATTFLPPHRRAIGYVFQEASLFPHLSVRQNLLYGHRRALRAGAAEALKPADVIALLGLSGLLDRAPAKLSGGERQRVAIGRALLAQPRLLLMDEPLGALDAAARNELLAYLETLHATLAIPMVYVSHDLSEVERLADTIVLMAAGSVVAAGPLADILTNAGLPLAQAAGASAVVPAVVSGREADGLLRLRLGGETLFTAMAGDIASGANLRIRIRADDVSLAVERPSPTTILNVLPARIAAVHPVDAGRAIILLDAGHDGAGPRFLASITLRSLHAFAFRPGQPVFAQIKSVSLLAARQAAGSTPADVAMPGKAL